MRTGQNLIIDLDKFVPDFKTKYTNEAENFPADTVFNQVAFKDPGAHMKMVRDEENKNVLGDKDCFMMHENFNIVFVAKYKDDATCQTVIDNIPHSDLMAKFYII